MDPLDRIARMILPRLRRSIENEVSNSPTDPEELNEYNYQEETLIAEKQHLRELQQAVEVPDSLLLEAIKRAFAEYLETVDDFDWLIDLTWKYLFRQGGLQTLKQQEQWRLGKKKLEEGWS